MTFAGVGGGKWKVTFKNAKIYADEIIIKRVDESKEKKKK